jgi:polar amino acid transport system substrate-binding protein
MRVIFFLLCLLFWETTGYCDEPLKVGIVVEPPFVIKKDGEYTGISVALWTEVAKNLQRSYTFIEYSCTNNQQRACMNTAEPLEILEKGDVDVLIGNLSITIAGYQKADFTFPYFGDTVIALTTINYMYDIVYFLKMFFISTGSILAICIVLFLIYIHLLWHYERHHSPYVSKDYKEGISRIFWVHTLNGRHIEIPRSREGKFLMLLERGAFYIILIMLNAAVLSFTTVTLSRYANPIQNLLDLKTHKVGAVKNSKPFKLGVDSELRVIPFDSLPQGLEALKTGKITAFIEHFSVAESYLKEKGIVDLSISRFSLKRDLYSFATPIGSPLLRDINIQMLALRKLGIPQKICKVYFIEGIKNCEM